MKFRLFWRLTNACMLTYIQNFHVVHKLQFFSKQPFDTTIQMHNIQFHHNIIQLCLALAYMYFKLFLEREREIYIAF